MSPFVKETEDYSRIKSKIEKKLVVVIFKYLLKGIPASIDFLDGDVICLNKDKGDTTKIIIAPPKFFNLLSIARNANFYAGEEFIKGKWFFVKGSVAEFVTLFKIKNKENIRSVGLFLGFPMFLTNIYKQYLRPLVKLRETKHHYNKDTRVYEKIIGKNMVYSCAFFNDQDISLEQAQDNKLSTTLQRLDIDSTNKDKKLLDIGCGWGSFMIYVVQNTKVQVDGISIASSQIEYAKKRLESLDKKTQERVNFITSDFVLYRENEKDIYDNVSSIGMLEHVGKTQYLRYFNKINQLLKPGGKAVIHSIVAKKLDIPNPWIDKYIFPGGYIPAATQVLQGIEKSPLRIEGLFFHKGENYRKTLEKWSENLVKHYDACYNYFIENLIKDNPNTSQSILEKECRKIMRIWYFYLESVQCVFDARLESHDVCQFVVSKRK